jgi:hypothetical protein
MSWLEDFSDGEAFWQRLMAAPTFAAFLQQADHLSRYERDLVLLYHAIRERQAAGDWTDWAGDSAEV